MESGIKCLVEYLKRAEVKMNCYFYRIRCYQSYHWVDAHKGIVFAESSKDAKKQIDEIIRNNTDFLIVKKKASDYNSGDFKVVILLCNDYWLDYWTRKRNCKECSSEYVVIENQQNGIEASDSYCSEDCRLRFRLRQREESFESYLLTNKHPAIIYKITHRPTGQVYIGQTSQAFTLRWYQHFFHAGDTKFHKLIKSSSPTEWIFEIQEIISDKKDQSFINQREKFWIDHYDSVARGLNTANFKELKNEE